MPDRLLPEQLRSYRWFGPNDLRSFGHRSRARQLGLGPEDWQGKPVIGLLTTWSEIKPCHLHCKIPAENVKKGVLQAGGRPAATPRQSPADTVTKPAASHTPTHPALYSPLPWGERSTERSEGVRGGGVYRGD